MYRPSDSAPSNSRPAPRRFALAGATAIAFSLFPGATALAASPSDIVVYEHPLLRGDNAGDAPVDETGRPERARQVGAGIEHAHVAVCGSSFLIVGVGSYLEDSAGVGPDMGSDNERVRRRDRLQTMAIAGKLSSGGMEIGGAYYVLPDLTRGNRNRDGMKPQAACLDAEAGLFVVDANYAPDNRARTYMSVFAIGTGADGAPMPVAASETVEVLASQDDDCSDRDAGDMIVSALGGGSYAVDLTGSCNGAGQDVAWFTRASVSCTGGDCSITAGDKVQVSQGEIERFRPQTYSLGDGRLLVIGTEGDNQPPRMGISATVVDPASLDIVSQSIIAEAITRERDGNRILSTMSHGAQIDDNTFIVSFQQREGRRRRGGKGDTTMMIGVLQTTAAGDATWVVEPQSGLIEGFSATHHTACSINYGITGSEQPAGLFVSAAFTGGAPARATIVGYDGTQLAIHETVGTGTNIDAGLIPNYYGNNPGGQGKNSLYCASIANPGYGAEGGFMPEVKEFALIPGSSRVTDASGALAPKLGLDVVLVPVVFDSPQAEEPPEEGGGDGSGGGDGDGSGDGSGGGAGSPQPGPRAPVGGCASAPAGGAALALPLLLIAALSRRRRRL